MYTPVRIFYSYSHKDEELLNELKEALSPLKRQGIIQEFYDRKILPGTDWQSAIDKNLERADVIILLISASFLSSDYCYGKEMKRGIERYKAGETQVIPVIVRPCIWQMIPQLEELNVLPTDGKAVITWEYRDLAWTDVVKGIHRVIDAPMLKNFYLKLCADGQDALLNQDIEVAPFLDNLTQDKRLGLTLIGRLSKEVAVGLQEINERLRHTAPGQFYYDQRRFHFTILSIINAVDPAKVSKKLACRYIQPIEELLKGFLPFEIKFSGIGATGNSIIAKGFPADDTLYRLRDVLRQRLGADGLGQGLDERYRIQGAHVTMARFKVKEDFSSFIKLINQLHDKELGHMNVFNLQLVINDFYMSEDKVQLIAGLSLGDTTSVGMPDEFEVKPKILRHNLQIKPINIVGRENELGYIVRSLAQSEKPAIITSGFGGIGKSTLAKFAAWTFVEREEPFNFIAWIDLRQYDEAQMISLNFILDEIARDFDLNSDIPTISNIEAKQDRVKELLKNHRSLLILDNYEGLFAYPLEERKVSVFLKSLPIGPMGAGGDTFIRILITTREVSSGLRALSIEEFGLKKLSFEDSLKLMKLWTPQQIKLTNRHYKNIWEKLCGLPKYMQIAIEQLRMITFDHWTKIIADIKWPLDEGELFFHDLFKQSWKRFSGDFKKVLMSMTYFSGEVSPGALQNTSGLSEKQFFNVMVSVSDAYIESTGQRYTVHPLTHAYCRAMLNSLDFIKFREESGHRFVEYFLEFSRAAGKDNKKHLIEREIRNIVTAANLAKKLELREHLIGFQEYIIGIMRFRGYWHEQIEITLLAANACREVGKKEMLARYLVFDLGWYYLRLEDLERAEKHINEGLELYEKLGNLKGIAQALRHLGKSALLKGLNPWYQPGELWGKYSPLAEQYYLKSLQIRKQLANKKSGQRTNIGDMKLDFGRLYWLQGKKCEKDGRKDQDHELINEALKKYEQANAVSREAMNIFEDISLERGIAKAWGNLGNATKEIVRFYLNENKMLNAVKHVKEAQDYYENSLKIANRIGRRDEIAHSYWGLAEVYELFAHHPELQFESGNKEKFLGRALEYAEESHKIYLFLGGSKDINATKSLVTRIKDKLLPE
jgi:2'-5' RNA ligase